MYVSVYLETESPSQPPYFKNTSFCSFAFWGLWLDLDRQIPGPVTGALGHSLYCPFVVVEITENNIFSGAKFSYPRRLLDLRFDINSLLAPGGYYFVIILFAPKRIPSQKDSLASP